MKVAYIRVSSIDQNESRQIEALEQYGIDKWYMEKVSGKDTNRPKLQEMLDFVREGDTVYIMEFARLARSTKDLLNIVEYLQNKGVHLVSHKETLDTTTPAGKFMLTMLAAVAEFERQTILERQREGIAIAKKEGKYMGRQHVKIDEEQFTKAYERYMRREINKVQFAQEVNLSRPTLDRILKERTAKEA